MSYVHKSVSLALDDVWCIGFPFCPDEFFIDSLFQKKLRTDTKTNKNENLISKGRKRSDEKQLCVSINLFPIYWFASKVREDFCVDLNLELQSK